MAEMTAMSPQKPAAPQRANSTSSAGTAMSTGSMGFAPRFVPRPEPAYVSPESAAEHVSRLTQADQYDVRSPTASPCGDAVTFSDASLQLVNGFLDALLYNILGKARGTSMSKLRPAIKQVLSGRLARDALQNAEEEMLDLVDETESSIEQENARSASRNEVWHLEQAFKLMRLRVMVFCKLGVFDDENEEAFLEEDDNIADLSILDGPSAVFLASILEFLTERLLDVAGEAAFERSRRQSTMKTPTIRESRELPSPANEDLQVEEMDVNKIALNPGFARLWRTWRKSQQHMNPSAAVQQSRDGLGLRLPRRASQDPSTVLGRQISLEDVPEGEVAEHDIAANIPLPMTDNDINEIEIPGLAKQYLDDGTEALPTPEPTPRERWIPKRPGSALSKEVDDTTSSRPAFKRLRSNSMPMLSMPGAFTFDPATEQSVLEDIPAENVGQNTTTLNTISDDVEPAEEALLKVQSKDTADHLVDDDEDEAKESIGTVEPETPYDDNMFPVDGGLDKGFFAAAAAGAAALATAAVATVVGTSSKKDNAENSINSVEIKRTTKPGTPTSGTRDVDGTTTSPSAKSSVSAVAPASVAAKQDQTPALTTGNHLPKDPAAEFFNAPINADTPIQPNKFAALRAGFETKDSTAGTIASGSPQEPTTQLSSQRLSGASYPTSREAAISRGISPSPITPSTTGPIPPRLPLTVNRSPTPTSRPTFAAPTPQPQAPVKEQVPDFSTLRPVEDNSSVAAIAPAYVDDEYDPFAPTNFNTKPKSLGRAGQAHMEPPSPVSPVSPIEEQRGQEHDAYTLKTNPRNQFYPSKQGLPPMKPLPDLPRASKSSELAGMDPMQLGSSPPNSSSQRDTMGSFYGSQDGRYSEDPIGDVQNDAQPIGTARTSNVRIQSQHSPTPEQLTFMHANRFSDSSRGGLGSDAANGPTTSATVQPDELISINRMSGPGKYSARAPSPLTQFMPSSAMTDAPEPPERTSSRGRDRAMATPLAPHHQTRDSRMSVSSTYSQPDGGIPRSSGDSPHKDAAANAALIMRGGKVPPLQTTFVPTSIAEEPRPSSGQKSSRGSIVVGKANSSDNEKGRAFDDLVKSGETVKYTLTPDGLRDNRAFDGPVTNSKFSVPLSPGGDKAIAAQNGQRSSPPGSKAGVVAAPVVQPVVQPSPPSVRQVAPVVAEVAPPPPPKPMADPVAQPVAQPVVRAPSPVRRVIPRPSQYRNSANPPLAMRPSTVNTSNPRNPRLVPREARVVTERLADFADFMRSTAPSNESQGTPYVLQVAKTQAAAPVSQVKKPKSRLQAREADTKRSGGSTDLIEFIRQGPSGTGDSNGRLPNLSNGTTTNRSALNGNGNGTTAHQSLSSNPTSGASRSQPPAPPAADAGRKQYRNKDPYAIDFLDTSDYEDEDQGTSYGGPVNGASLPPPPSTNPPPTNLSSYLAQASPPHHSLPPTTGQPSNSRYSSPAGIPGGPSPLISQSDAQVGSGSSGIPARTTSNASNRAPPVLRGPQRRIEARAAVMREDDRAGTSALADFLRSSEPPAPTKISSPLGSNPARFSAPGPSVPKKRGSTRMESVSSVAPSTESRRSRIMFWRR